VRAGEGKVPEKHNIPVWGTGGREFKSPRSDHVFREQTRNCYRDVTERSGSPRKLRLDDGKSRVGPIVLLLPRFVNIGAGFPTYARNESEGRLVARYPTSVHMLKEELRRHRA
jgi:hypothetical protein